MHAFFGNMMGLFLIDTLIQAIKDLGPNDYNPVTKLKDLLAERDKEYDTFMQSTIPADSKSITGFFNASITSQVDPIIFFRNRAICRTSLLPAQSRYKGYMTPGVDPTFDHDYDKGIAMDVIHGQTANGKLRVAFDRSTRQSWCPISLGVDFKDHFYASEKDGLVSTTFPSDKELNAYDPWEPNGILIFCFAQCSWGECPEGDRRLRDVNAQRLKIAVNDVAVIRMWEIAKGFAFDQCGVIEGSDGMYFKRNTAGSY
jgi:hypothetical protein